jgi:hypothetical protein
VIRGGTPEVYAVASRGVTTRTERHDRRLTLGLPAAVTVAVWFVCVLVVGWSRALDYLTAAGASLVVLGATVVFGRAVLPGISLSTYELAGIVAYGSVVTSFVYAFNMDLLERVPRLGDYLRRARTGARASLHDHPWIRRMATAGVGLFVLTPLPAAARSGGPSSRD